MNPMTILLLIITIAALLLVLGMATPGIGPRPYGAKTGAPLRVSADGQPRAVVGGITIDWTDANIPTGAAGTGTTLLDGTYVPPGVKYLRLGSVVFWTVTANKRDKAKVALTATALVRDRTAVLNETVVEGEQMDLHAGGAFYGGRVFRQRLNVGGAWPTEAALLTACPLLELVED
jgi:hypothetical protein